MHAVLRKPTTRTAQVPALMHLLCDLLLSAACWGFTFTAAHVPGVENNIADAISRFRCQVFKFRQLAPEAPAGQLNTSSLEQQCLHFLAEGLAPSTWQAYSSGQCKFLDFCCEAGKLHSNGLPCPADKWTLCLFVSFLADLIQHSSKLKVYLSAVRSSHIEQDFSDPLLNCPWLQRVLSGVKRSQGSLAAQHLLITYSLLLVIHRTLVLKSFDHCAFWAACMFGFLRAAEFTVPNLASFSPAINFSVADIVVDSLQSPTCLHVKII